MYSLHNLFSSVLSMHSARHVVQWASLSNKNLVPLDLSLCEYSRANVLLCTRKHYLHASTNALAWTLNLDWDDRLEERFFNNTLSFNLYRYNHNFLGLLPQIEVDIYECIRRSDDVCLALDRFLKPANLLRLCSAKRTLTQGRSFQACNMFLNFLASNCENTEHAIHVLQQLHEMCNPGKDLDLYFFTRSTKKKMEYAFKQVQKARCDVFGLLPTSPSRLDCCNQPVVHTFYLKQFELVPIFLKYGISMDFGSSRLLIGGQWNREGFFEVEFRSWLDDPNEDVIAVSKIQKEHLNSLRRQLLMTQVFTCHSLQFVYNYNTSKSTECLRLLWRSLPDAYLSRDELLRDATKPWKMMGTVLYKGTDTRTLVQIHEWYVQEVVEGSLSCPGAFLQPRSLLQYSRCAVRRQLACSFELPGGIPALGLSKPLEKYLRLEW